jgi:alkanesulfonate monooxygenase SsuD/methylene tetrahydromethanopterin reductase-like flavin-dependent oxidoreductase (luciferase family)
VKIGFFAIGIANLARAELITAVATNAERLNFATVWAPEHVVFLERFSSRYPYARGQNIPIPTETPLLNPFLALTYAAARTSRVRLATGICLVPEYNPLLLAKICATLDSLSGGRFALEVSGSDGCKRNSRRLEYRGKAVRNGRASTLKRCVAYGVTSTVTVANS